MHFVADDRDYYSVIDPTKGKAFLQNEWENSKLSEIWFYRSLSQFLGNNYPDIHIASEAELEGAVQALVSSKNFASTHQAIATLSSYDYIGPSHAEAVAGAYIENEQVQWILTDSDVFEYLCEIKDKYLDSLNWKTKRQIIDLHEKAAEVHKGFEMERDVPF